VKGKIPPSTEIKGFLGLVFTGGVGGGTGISAVNCEKYRKEYKQTGGQADGKDSEE